MANYIVDSNYLHMIAEAYRDRANTHAKFTVSQMATFPINVTCVIGELDYAYDPAWVAQPSTAGIEDVNTAVVCRITDIVVEGTSQYDLLDVVLADGSSVTTAEGVFFTLPAFGIPIADIINYPSNTGGVQARVLTAKIHYYRLYK